MYETDQLYNEVLALSPSLRRLRSRLSKLQLQAQALRAQAQTDADNVEVIAKTLFRQIDLLNKKVEKSLASFMDRGSYTFQHGREPLPLPGQPLRFCHGATLCQLGMATADELSVACNPQEPKRWGFTCKYCFLEVGKYCAIRVSHNGQPAVDFDMLAASHSPTCKSFVDRRAYYKCIPCHKLDMETGFSSATDLEIHSRRHAGHEFINYEKATVDSTSAQMERYIRESGTRHDTVESLDEDVTCPEETGSGPSADGLPDIASQHHRTHHPVLVLRRRPVLSPTGDTISSPVVPGLSPQHIP